jgi:hypothetical protein
MKTGSELMSEMVGPAGSMSEGAFSRWTGDAEEELCCELDDCACEKTRTAMRVRAKASEAESEDGRKSMNDPCLKCIFRRSEGVKRKDFGWRIALTCGLRRDSSDQSSSRGRIHLRNHAASSASAMLPSATLSIVVTPSASPAVSSYPFLSRKVSATTHAVRLLPSKKA